MAAKIVRVSLQLLCITSAITISTSADISGTIRFLVEPTDVIVAKGGTAAFHCKVDKFGEPVYVVWFHNNVEIVNSKHRFVDDNGSLILTKVRKKTKNGEGPDFGEYKCLARARTVGLLSRTATLRMAELSPFSKHPENVTVPEGETARLSCHVKSLPAAEITWIFQNESINYEALKRFDASIPGVLYIRNVRASDAGEYRCVATNSVLSFETRTSAAGTLTISQGASEPSHSTTFLSPPLPSVMSIYENEPLVLECGVPGPSDAVKIAWTFKKTADSSESLIVETPCSYSILRKPNITTEDGGTYTCVVSPATDSVRNVNSSVFVEVMTPPTVEVEPKFESLPAARGTRFTCNARGRPQPAITWLHNGEELTMSDFRFHMKRTENELILKSPMSSDAGIYQCVASNALGMASAHGYLHINDSFKPSAPVNVRCDTLNSTSVRVRWDIAHDADESGARPPIIIKNKLLNEEDETDSDMLGDEDTSSSKVPSQAFTVNYSPVEGGKELVMPTTEKKIDIGGLNAIESYVFYVRAFNGASGSEPSKRVVCETLDPDLDSEVRFPGRRPPPPPLITSDTPKRPGPPIQGNSYDLTLFASPLNSSAIRAWWTFDRPNIGTSDDEYKIVCKNTNGHLIKSMEVTFENKEAIITDLEPKTLYEISMKVVVNHTNEGNVATRMASTKGEFTFEPPQEFKTYHESPTNIRISWETPRTKDAAIDHYIVEYSILGAKGDPYDDNDLSSRTILETKTPEAQLVDLTPNVTYNVRIEAFDTRGNRSGRSVPYLMWTATSEENPLNPNPVREVKNVENVQTEVLNSNSVRVWWTDPNGKPSYKNPYFVTYTPAAADITPIKPAFLSDRYFADLRGLESGGSYQIQIKSKRLSAHPVIVGTATFTMDFVKPDEKSKESTDEGVTVFMGYSIDSEYFMGAVIGIIGSVALICVCIFIICWYRDKYEKPYRQVATGPCIVPSNDRHEMNVLGKNENGFLGQLNNAQSPLLVSNGHYPNVACENGQIYGVGSAKLLNGLSNGSSLTSETILSALERDHECGGGGDSGYGDPNQAANPSIKDGSSEGALESRKCSETIMDDGFYDGETSPGKKHSAT